MNKTVTFTQQELATLKAYLFCDPCRNAKSCLYDYKRIDCNSIGKDGSPACALLRNKQSIEEKLFGREHE